MVNINNIIGTVDAHTGGEPVRVIRSGLPAIPGKSMAEKKNYFVTNLDHLRTLLMQEPRGHNDMFGVVLTPPCNDKAHFGLLFLDNGGYLDMCGHGIIGVTTVLIETGMHPSINEQTTIIFDTPAGLITSHAKIEDSRVVEVSFVNVPSFIFKKDVSISVDGKGTISCDIGFGGNFFAMVDVTSIGLTLCKENLSKLIPLGLKIRDTVNKDVEISHPIHHHMDDVKLTEFYEQPEPSQPFSRSLVVFGNGQFDRSPCGTGVSATMALLYSKTELDLGIEFVVQSLIGSQFKGELLRTVDLHSITAVEPMITGSAFMTGIHQFVHDPNDPIGYGFTLNS